jgi:diguanylate cyclase (GGDEF)-like protein
VYASARHGPHQLAPSSYDLSRNQDETPRITTVSFRARLTLFFLGIVVVPLGVSTVVVNRIAAHNAVQRTDERVSGLTVGVQRVVERQFAAAQDILVDEDVAERAYRAATAEGRLDRIRRDAEFDFLVVAIRGEVAAASLAPASFLPDVHLDASDLTAEPGPEGLVAIGRVTIENVPGNPFVVGGYYWDQRALNDVIRMQAMTVSHGRVVASTLDPPPVVTVPETPDPFDVGSRLRGQCVCFGVDAGSGIVVLVSRNAGDPLGDLSPLILLVVAFGVVAATILAYLLARLLSRPLEQLTEEALAATTTGPEVAAARGDDVARLGVALGAMRDRLQTTVAQLDESRVELRRGLERLGETLTATHDLDELLEVVLEAAASTLDAESGAVYLRSGRRAELVAHASYGMGAPRVLSMREGLAGSAVALGRPVLSSGDQAVALSAREPAKETGLAVPLSRSEEMIGAVALYGHATGTAFTEEDLETLASFGEQMSVAIENVYQHEETERLSFTDSLTGAWNRRYLELTLNEETQRGQRFGRPYSVLMLDLDRFKRVNDRHGHRKGDAVLVEMCQRIGSSIRSHIDTLARFGGEEFVVVLPETGREGAMAAAEKIRQLVRAEPFGDGKEAVKVSISVGVATFPLDGGNPEELIRAADRALYEAKRAGRDRVVAHVR